MKLSDIQRIPCDYVDASAQLIQIQLSANDHIEIYGCKVDTPMRIHAGIVEGLHATDTEFTITFTNGNMLRYSGNEIQVFNIRTIKELLK